MGSRLNWRLASGLTMMVAVAVACADDQLGPWFLTVPVSLVSPDSISLHSVGQVSPVRFTVIGVQGTPIRGWRPSVGISDSSVATILAGTLSDTAVRLRGLRNGSATLTLTVGNLRRDIPVHVNQVSRVLVLSAPLLDFTALGDSARLTATAYDSLGVPIESASLSFATRDAGTVDVDSAGVMWSRGNGVTTIVVTDATGATDSLMMTVAQVADTLEASLADTGILRLNLGDRVPLTCRAVDRNGYPLAISPLVTPGDRGTVGAAACSSVVAQRSGFDTLTVASGTLSVRVPIVLVLEPVVSSPIGEFLAIDSTPNSGFWAPSMRRNSRGEFELYYASYSSPDSTGYTRADLHRLVSGDGLSFHYAGVVLRHDDDLCALDGRGIENVAVVPRADGPGWRMFYAGGSDPCYGWQVFSAVSADESTWTKEPDVRLSNGGTVPPAPPVYAPWPVGEGMAVDQLPGGEWRMLTGGYEHLQPYEDVFQIVEWRSPDQLAWNYVGPVLTTRDMPPEADASVYSPAIREFAPGLFRMIFTGDNRHSPGGRSRLWSAVSVDRTHWLLEGELMGGAGTDLYYSALVDDLLVFVRKDANAATLLAGAMVIMN